MRLFFVLCVPFSDPEYPLCLESEFSQVECQEVLVKEVKHMKSSMKGRQMYKTISDRVNYDSKPSYIKFILRRVRRLNFCLNASQMIDRVTGSIFRVVVVINKGKIRSVGGLKQKLL